MRRSFIKPVITSLLMILLLTQTLSFAATISIQDWDLVDSGKHCDYDGDSIYMSYIETGASTWNSYKSGVLRPDTILVIEDVNIFDFDWAGSSYAGLTSPNGTLKFNIYYMDGYTESQRLNVATHELGHCLGLDHNLSFDLMYEYVTSKTTLSTNDKASYDAAYANY